MKDSEILGRLREIRRLREHRAEASLGRHRISVKQAEQAAQEEASLHASHLARSAAAEQRHLQIMTATIVDASSLQWLDAQRKRMAMDTALFEQKEQSAQQSVERLLATAEKARKQYARLHMSGKKLDEVMSRFGTGDHHLGRGRAGSADENEEWPF